MELDQISNQLALVSSDALILLSNLANEAAKKCNWKHMEALSWAHTLVELRLIEYRQDIAEQCKPWFVKSD